MEIFKDWEEKLEENHFYFVHSYEKLTDNLSSEDAFNSRPDVLSVLLSLKDSYLISETIDFLHRIYNLANTTEIHPFIKAILIR